MVLFNNWADMGVHTFPKGICRKVNVIARLEYELAYYDSAVQRFNHNTTRTPPQRNCLDAHLGQIVCEKDEVVDWCIVQVEMPLTRFKE